MRQLLAVMALATGAFCTTAHGQTGTRGLTADPTLTVEVQNNRTVPVTVDLEYGAFDHRIGVVPPMQTESLSLPGWIPGQDDVRLFVHPEDGRDLETPSLTLRPGMTLALLVPARGPVPAEPAETMTERLTTEELSHTTLTVDNPRSQAVTVYADQGPFDVRLGTVAAHTRETLKLPDSALYAAPDLQIVVHPEGGWDLASETLTVRRGEHLGLRVPTHP